MTQAPATIVAPPAPRQRSGLVLAIKKMLATMRAGRTSIHRRWTRPNVYNNSTAERIGVVFNNPSELAFHERMFLYSLVRGMRPQRALEIGTCQGGSAVIICAAMEDAGRGQLIGLDPGPTLTVKESLFHDRFTLIRQASPDGITAARQRAGGDFDIVFIDGLHTHDQVVKDLIGVKPFLAPHAVVLLHDAMHYGVAEAIRKVLIASDGALVDCGYVCNDADTSGKPVAYRGLRMLRHGPRVIDSPQEWIAQSYAALNEAPPTPDQRLWNHDIWACRALAPCEWCKAHAK